MHIQKVISGGQTGTDLGGLEAAFECGIPTGGWCPAHYRNELGPKQMQLKLFGLHPTPSQGYAQRTKLNIQGADLTVLIAQLPLSGGSALTLELCQGTRPCITIDMNTIGEPGLVLLLCNRLLKFGNPTINVAGNRESKSPGIQAATKRLLVEVFHELEKGNG